MIDENEIVAFCDHIEEGVQGVDVELVRREFRPWRRKHIDPAAMASCKYFEQMLVQSIGSA